MFEQLLSQVGSSLRRHGLPYMVIGGQALLLHGEPRLTRDIDITLGVGPEHLTAVLAVLKDLSLQPLPEDVESFVRETMVLPAVDKTTGIRIDFIFSFTPYEQEAIKRAQKVALRNGKVNFAAAEDLVIHKIFAARARDIEDAKSVLLKNPHIDAGYIRRWLKVFDASATEKRHYLRTFEDLLKELDEGECSKPKKCSTEI